MLEQPGSRLSLQQVVQACGYISPVSFSRDFLCRYGERPSQVQRRFRDHNLLERLGNPSSAPTPQSHPITRGDGADPSGSDAI